MLYLFGSFVSLLVYGNEYFSIILGENDFTEWILYINGFTSVFNQSKADVALYIEYNLNTF